MQDRSREKLVSLVNELNCLIDELRPDPEAELVSRAYMRAMAELANNDDLRDIVKQADRFTLFWRVRGEFIEQRITIPPKSLSANDN